MTDDHIKQVLYEHTKLNPNQADDQVLLAGAVRAIRQLQSENFVGYLHADGFWFMPPEIFDAWSRKYETPYLIAQFRPVYSHGNQIVPNELRGDEATAL